MKRPLDRALAALRSARPTDALEALLEAWAEAPSRELAACIAGASELVRTSPPELRGKTKRSITAWTALGRAPKPADVPALLESLADVLWRDAYARLVMIRKWRPDPRVDEALVRLLEAMPYRSTSKPFYTELIGLLAHLRDPAQLARIARARDTIQDVMSPTLGDWLERRVDELIEELAPVVAEPKRPPAVIEKIREAIGAAARANAPREELAELLESIYEQPDDTARRLVYADALQERDDPRGELIALQCTDAPTPEQQRRAKALVKKHGAQWLGPLAPILSKWTFERGFLADCRVNSNKGSRIRPLVGHPAWATVHTLADSAQIALHPIMRSLRTLEFRPNRTRQREQLDEAWRELLAGTPRPIERLHYTDLDMYEDRELQVELLGRCDALPKLRQLYVGGIACFHANELARAPIATRIDTLGFMFESYDDPPRDFFSPDMRESPIPRIVIVVEGVTVTVERGAKALERARFVVDNPRAAYELIAILPSSIRELRVETPPDLDRGVLVALAAAARALPLEVSEIGPRA